MEHGGNRRDVWPSLGGSWGHKLWLASLYEGAPYNDYWGEPGFIKEGHFRWREQNEQRLRSLAARLLQRSPATFARTVLMELRGWRPDSGEMTHSSGEARKCRRISRRLSTQGVQGIDWQLKGETSLQMSFLECHPLDSKTEHEAVVKHQKTAGGKRLGCRWKEICGMRNSYPFKSGSFPEGRESAEDTDTVLPTTRLW